MEATGTEADMAAVDTISTTIRDNWCHIAVISTTYPATTTCTATAAGIRNCFCAESMHSPFYVAAPTSFGVATLHRVLLCNRLSAISAMHGPMR